MQPKLELAAITDEYSPDLAVALEAMAETGMTAAELRVLWGKNIMSLTDEEVRRAAGMVQDRGMRVISIASPVLKCVLPGAPPVDTRFQQDVFAAVHTIDDQPRLVERGFEILRLTGAKILRVFSYWRTVDPAACHGAIVDALGKLAEQAAKANFVIGLENEHACNVATGAESARILAAVDHPNLKLVWDPANALCAGEPDPFPGGYAQLPKHRIVHVHAKDCHMEGHKPVWGPVGTRHIDWKGQIAALLADGYRGAVSLETHWTGPGGDKLRASTICGWNLRGLLAS
jgi:sugar phosphate isomerase/epimerase